jgi:putative transposase
LRRPVEPKQ